MDNKAKKLSTINEAISMASSEFVREAVQKVGAKTERIAKGIGQQ